MKEHYVTYEQAVKLKELRFDWKCIHFYYTMTKQFYDWSTYSADNYNTRKEKASAPRLDQVQTWLRETKGIIISIGPCFYMGRKPLMGYEYHLYDKDDGMRSHIAAPTVYNTYEQALSTGIDTALELLTNKS